MTEDQPKQPEPQIPTPPTPTPQPASTQARSTVQQVTQALEETWKQVEPVLKSASIKTLRGTIWVLEGAVKTLEAQPIQQIQPLADTLPSAATLPPQTAASIQPIEVAMVSEVTPTAPVVPEISSTVQPKVAAAPAAVPPAPQKQSFWQKSRPVVMALIGGWKAILGLIRKLLPESVKQKVPTNDTALTGAIAFLFILILWINSLLSPGKAPEVVKLPPATPIAPPEIIAPPEVVAPPEVIAPPAVIAPPEVVAPPAAIALPEVVAPPAAIAPPEVIAPPTAIAPPEVIAPPTAIALPEVKAPPKVKAAPTIKTPPELTAPKPTQPVKTIAPPAPVLTPEQKLVASIQEKVTQITKQYGDGLIQSIQANFQSGLLTAKVNDNWYSFSPSQQDQLVADMWSRAQELDFAKLEITDTKGTQLARNAVVGSNMVILKRQLLTASSTDAVEE